MAKPVPNRMKVLSKKVRRAEELSAPFAEAFKDAAKTAQHLFQELAHRAQTSNSEVLNALGLLERLAQTAYGPASFALKYLKNLGPAARAAIDNDPNGWLQRQLKQLRKGLKDDGK